MWRDNDVQSTGEGAKRLRHPLAGEIAFEFSFSAVDDRPDFRLITCNPASLDEAEKAFVLLDRSESG